MPNESPFTSGLLVALVTGLVIGFQGIFSNLVGQSVGPLRAGFVIHIAGTLVGAALVLIFTQARAEEWSALNLRTILTAMIAGACGMIIISGIAYSFPQIGQVAGQTTLIFGQMVVAIVVDMSGLATGTPIPLDLRRIAGLVILAIAIVLLLPRSDS